MLLFVVIIIILTVVDLFCSSTTRVYWKPYTRIIFFCYYSFIILLFVLVIIIILNRRRCVLFFNIKGLLKISYSNNFFLLSLFIYIITRQKLFVTLRYKSVFSSCETQFFFSSFFHASVPLIAYYSSPCADSLPYFGFSTN